MMALASRRLGVHPSCINAVDIQNNLNLDDDVFGAFTCGFDDEDFADLDISQDDDFDFGPTRDAFALGQAARARFLPPPTPTEDRP